MSEDNIKTLIDDMTGDWQPAGKMWHPVARVVPWAALMVVYIYGVVMYVGLRRDWPGIADDIFFIFEIGLTAMMAISAAIASSWLGIPDMGGRKWVLYVPLTLFGVFILWLGCHVYGQGGLPLLSRHQGLHHCFSEGLLMGTVPVAGLMFLTRRGATTRPFMSAFMSILAGGALGWIGLRFSCGATNMVHVLLYHFLPFVLMGGVIGSLARWLYRW